ncbi:hypothetical protein GYMLUDRAFT_62352 [Collybiopsis luxurians FD-317 M1]|uniref:Uncharacterized protein n=1 Tax=Collybiopsis luxurians FD-317 M1 TaxID=944289 RepID=A0A0D0AYL2_9AGAR|nr:hypothetical protein GYMLUDRAFT_62352 [Collybiopsis luxurians FD-317 M1]
MSTNDSLLVDPYRSLKSPNNWYWSGKGSMIFTWERHTSAIKSTKAVDGLLTYEAEEGSLSAKSKQAESPKSILMRRFMYPLKLAQNYKLNIWLLLKDLRKGSHVPIAFYYQRSVPNLAQEEASAHSNRNNQKITLKGNVNCQHCLMSGNGFVSVLHYA